jgi:hypothetical protein
LFAARRSLGSVPAVQSAIPDGITSELGPESVENWDKRLVDLRQPHSGLSREQAI